MSRNLGITAAVLVALGAASAAQAGPLRTMSGSFGNLNWKASNAIVGQTSTATAAGGGDPKYFPTMPKYSGTVALIMEFADGAYICSGSLLSDRRSILTAAHCVTDGSLGKPLSTTAYFYDGADPDTIVPISPAATAVDVSAYFVNSAYTGDVIDQNDIAVLRLAEAAPEFAVSYNLFEGELTGQQYNIAGYGARSDTGGAVGANLGAGRLRQGDNRFDYRMGDADFTGGWELIFGLPTEQIGFSYLSDFDNGLDANDMSCLIAADPFFGLAGPKFCNTGVGDLEVSSAGGDSGGPQFIDGMIASVTSYGLTFGSDYGDFDDDLNSSWGEYNGFVPVNIHTDFIFDSMYLPEPGTLALFGLGLAGLGFGRRRRA